MQKVWHRKNLRGYHPLPLGSPKVNIRQFNEKWKRSKHVRKNRAHYYVHKFNRPLIFCLCCKWIRTSVSQFNLWGKTGGLVPSRGMSVVRECHVEQWRRLVIDIGGWGKNVGHKYWGAQILGKYIFRQHSRIFFFLKPFYYQNCLMTFSFFL